MAHKINDSCVNCGACVDECGLDAIYEKDGQYIIDPEACTDCGVCIAACPADAITAE